MATVRIDALVARMQRALALNSTDGTFSTPEVSDTIPAGAYDLAPSGAVGHGALMLLPFCTGAANTTFSIRVIGWKQVGANPATLLFVPIELYEADCIAGNRTGLAGHEVLDTERFADTITLVFGNANVSCETLSPMNNNNGHIAVDMKGCKYATVLFAIGTATDANCLIGPF